MGVASADYYEPVQDRPTLRIVQVHVLKMAADSYLLRYRIQACKFTIEIGSQVGKLSAA